MLLKWLFDRTVAFLGLMFLWPILLIVAIMVKIKMLWWSCTLCTEASG